MQNTFQIKKQSEVLILGKENLPETTLVIGEELALSSHQVDEGFNILLKNWEFKGDPTNSFRIHRRKKRSYVQGYHPAFPSVLGGMSHNRPVGYKPMGSTV